MIFELIWWHMILKAVVIQYNAFSFRIFAEIIQSKLMIHLDAKDDNELQRNGFGSMACYVNFTANLSGESNATAKNDSRIIVDSTSFK